ncbi:MAG: Flagellar hook-length control protein fliK, partial [Parcubacteria group bacterium GW2011_GWD2_38_12]
MLKKILKFSKNLFIFFAIFGIVFSNVSFYAASFMLETYIKGSNIVDRAWHLQKDSNVVDKFSSFRNLTEKLKIQETYAATSGQVYPTLGVTIAESPWLDNNWTNPTNIYSDNAATAYVIAASYDNGDQTYVLKATGFDFSAIPDGSTINGVTARMNAWYRSGQGSGAMDLCQLLDINKAKVGTNQCATQVALTTTNTTIITKGSTVDNWGNALDTTAIGIKATAANADVDVDYVTLEIDYTPPADTTPPTPDPMTFATAPNNTSATQIDMTATTATDATTPPVSYYFALDTSVCTPANVGTGAADSGWQSGTTYSDTGLGVNKCYGYKVKARDSVGTPNETGYSGITTLYTSANTPGTPTLGSPTTSTLALTNAENSNPASNPTTNFAVQVVTTSDGTWLNQWVDATGNPSATAVWLTDAQLDALVLQGLQASTLYGVKVKARNNDTDETALSAEGQGTTSAPSATVTASSIGTQTVNMDSGTTAQYIGAAFRFQQDSGTAVNITALTLTEAGGITFNNTGSSEVSNVSLSYKTADAGTCATGGETTVGNGTLNASDSVTWSAISIPATLSTNYTCVYVRIDLVQGAVYPNGGDTIDLKINASGDFTVDGGANKAGTFPVDPSGVATVLPNVTSITSYPDATQLGGKVGQTLTLAGAGFGA